MLKRFYSASMREVIASETQRTVAVNILTVGTKAAVAFVALGTMGVDTTPIVAGVGMIGAATGFALKDVGSNLISGIIIASSGTFHTGDELVIGTTKGKVVAMDLKYLYLETAEGDLVHVPNSIAVQSTVITKGGASPKRKGELLGEGDEVHLDENPHSLIHILRRLLFMSACLMTGFVLLVGFGGLKLIALQEKEKVAETPGVAPKSEYVVVAEKALSWAGVNAEKTWGDIKSKW